MAYIKGTYIKDIFSNTNNGYIVGILKVIESDIEDISNQVYFVGNFADLRYKTNYLMYGEMVEHPKYGKQFSVSIYEISLPTKREELVTFLSCEMFPIGEKTAKRIVDAFKEDTIEMILDNPDNLLLIPRISKDKANKIYEVLNDYQYSSKVVMDLTSLGFTSKESLSIVNKYKGKTMDKITDNVYKLIDDLDFSFLEVDRIALNMGIKDIDDRRLEAVILYVMESITFDTGDTYLYLDEIYSGVLNYCKSVNLEKLESIIYELNKGRKIIIKDDKYYLKK